MEIYNIYQLNISNIIMKPNTSGNKALAKKLQNKECRNANLSKSQCNNTLRTMLHQSPTECKRPKDCDKKYGDSKYGYACTEEKLCTSLTKKGCLDITKKKERKSPSESARCFDPGQKKKGNDGKMYEVRVIKNGVKRWFRL